MKAMTVILLRYTVVPVNKNNNSDSSQ